jgi:diguanylate cyclase (GGDEF)-like protein
MQIVNPMPPSNGQPVRPTVRKPARRTSTAAFAVLTVVLTLVAVGSMLSLHKEATAARQTQVVLSDLGRKTSLLSSYQWEARAARPGQAAAIRAEVATLVADLGRTERRLLDHEDVNSLREAVILTTRFRVAVADEIDAIERGDLKRVDEIDKQVVDPTFERLQPALDGLIREKDAESDRSLRLADYGSVLFGLMIAGALLTLMTFINRTRRRSLETRADALHEQAHEDALTGLANRRQLIGDLQDTLASGDRSHLALFDLDGFKGYNDAFGHVEGDLLLRRLASKLDDAVSPAGRAYRLGGDEFCVLWQGEAEDLDSRMVGAAGALEEWGEGFAVTAAHGSVSLPAEARSCDEALRVADLRMYAHKRGRSTATKEQIRNVALRAIAEQDGGLHSHVTKVGRLAAKLGARMGFRGEELRDLTYAAELHDVGKVAVPHGILKKRGSLDAAEWEFMRRHTIIGEAILGAAPALSTVAKYVRSSHERFDGGGYPDGLIGAEIPLASRLVFLCDSFSAMTQERPYRAAMTVGQARDEMRRCSGTQFDPDAVRAFCEVLDEAGATPGPPAAAAVA